MRQIRTMRRHLRVVTSQAREPQGHQFNGHLAMAIGKIFPIPHVDVLKGAAPGDD